MLFEIINPSDPYTMRADDFRVACIACNLIGAGQYALREVKDHKENARHEMPLFLFSGHNEWYFKQFGKPFKDVLEAVVNTQRDALIACLESVVVCLPEEHAAFAAQLTQLSPEAQTIFCEKWQKEHQTSLNNLRKVALDLGSALRTYMPPCKVEIEKKQQVECAWCKWQGDSPVKKFLKTPGEDYPLECRQCRAIGLRPVTESQTSQQQHGKSPALAQNSAIQSIAREQEPSHVES